jgi:hypothetical protein
MNLITTIAEFRAGLPVNVSSSVELLEAAIGSAERKHVLPVLGRAQYQELLAAYEAEDLSEVQAGLLKLVQVATANLAYAPYITIAQLQIDDQGIRIASDENNKTAFQWQIDDLREYLAETGYQALEDVLGFLDEHKDEFPLWAQSAAYTYNKQLLLNSATDFNTHYNIGGSRRTFLALLSIIGREEVFSIEPVLSAEFCAALRAEIQTGTVSDDTQAVLRLLHPALANFTVAEAIGELSVDLSGGGLVVRELAVGGANNRTKRQAPDNLLAVKRDQARANGRTYLQKLLALLNAKASETVYPEFFTSSAYVAPALPPDPNAPVYARRHRIFNAC